MQFASRLTLNSKLPGFEGVTFTLNKMTEGRRIKLRLELAEIQADIRRKLAAADDAAKEETPDIAKLTNLLAEVSSSTDDVLTPAWVRWGLRSVAGLEIQDDDAPDGAEPVYRPCKTADDLIAFGPPELYNEIVLAIKNEAGLSDAMQGESKRPSTSPAPVEPKNITSASPAGVPDTISPATAV